MPTKTYEMVRVELEGVVGDILSVGILNKGLTKVGTNPEFATGRDIWLAFDKHIESSLISFLGTKGAHQFVLRMKRKLEPSFGQVM